MVLTVAVYAPVRDFGFVYEDLNDPATFFRAPDWSAWASDAVTRPFRSLTGLTYGVNQALFGVRDAAGYHLMNLALHLVNGGLVYALLGGWAGAMALGLFLLHPVQVETVAYVSARADLVSVLCVLLALHAMRRPWLAWLCCGLAVLGKETAITAYLLVPAVAYLAGCRWSWPVRVVWGLFLLIPTLYLAGHYPLSLDVSHALTQVTAFTRLLLLVVWPVGLTIDHDWLAITPLVVWAVCAGWLLVALVAWQWRWPIWSLALGWCLLALSPRFVVPLVEGLHEHHLYLPMVGLSLAMGVGLSKGTDGVRLQGISAHVA